MILPSIGRRHAPQMADSRLSKQRRQYKSPSRSRHLCVNCLLHVTTREHTQNNFHITDHMTSLPTLAAVEMMRMNHLITICNVLSMNGCTKHHASMKQTITLMETLLALHAKLHSSSYQKYIKGNKTKH